MPATFSPSPVQVGFNGPAGSPGPSWAGWFTQYDQLNPGILLGRSSDLQIGPPQWITLGSGIALDGTVLSATGLGGDVVGPAASTIGALPVWDVANGKHLADSSVLAAWFNQSLTTADAPTFANAVINGFVFSGIIDQALLTTSSPTFLGIEATHIHSGGLGYGLVNVLTADNIAGYAMHYSGVIGWQMGRRGSSFVWATTGGAASDAMGTDRMTLDTGGVLTVTGNLVASNVQVSGAVQLADTGGGQFLNLFAGSNLSVNRDLIFTTGDATRTITLSGNPTLSDWFDQSVKTGASPTFANATINGSLFTNFFDQAVKTTSSPTFNVATVTGLSVNGSTVTVSGATTLDNWFDQSVKTTASPTFNQVNATTVVSTGNIRTNAAFNSNGTDGDTWNGGSRLTLDINGGGTFAFDVLGGIICNGVVTP